MGSEVWTQVLFLACNAFPCEPSLPSTGIVLLKTSASPCPVTYATLMSSLKPSFSTSSRQTVHSSHRLTGSLIHHQPPRFLLFMLYVGRWKGCYRMGLGPERIQRLNQLSRESQSQNTSPFHHSTDHRTPSTALLPCTGRWNSASHPDHCMALSICTGTRLLWEWREVLLSWLKCVPCKPENWISDSQKPK